jgi:hypothetical protein
MGLVPRYDGDVVDYTNSSITPVPFEQIPQMIDKPTHNPVATTAAWVVGSVYEVGEEVSKVKHKYETREEVTKLGNQNFIQKLQLLQDANITNFQKELEVKQKIQESKRKQKEMDLVMEAGDQAARRKQWIEAGFQAGLLDSDTAKWMKNQIQKKLNELS